LIDDERDLTEMIEFQLKDEGYCVEVAYDGLEGLEKLKTFTPDLIILDINLPRMGGIEFYKKTCLPDGSSRYPVLVMTARANLESVFQGLKVEGFLSKPFEIDVLLSEVRDILEKKNSDLNTTTP